jgi:hypothetical protein
LHAQGREHQAAAQPGGRADECVDDPPRGGGVRADGGEDQHGANRHLEKVIAEPQHRPEHQRAADQQPEQPPVERHERRDADGRDDAGDDADHLLYAAADRLEQAGLQHEQRGQGRQHWTARPGRDEQREQVGERGGGGQPGDVDGRWLGAATDKRELPGRSTWNGHAKGTWSKWVISKCQRQTDLTIPPT